MTSTFSPSNKPAFDLDGSIIMREVTDLKRLEYSAHLELPGNSNEQLQTIYQLTSALSEAGAVEEIYEEALQGLLRGLKADRASVLLFDADGVMRFKAWRGISDACRLAVEGHSPWTPDAIDPQPIMIENIEEAEDLGDLREPVLNEGIRAFALMPLRSRDRLLGKLMVYYDTPHRFTEEEIQISQTIARHVAFAIERKLIEQKLRAETETLRVLNRTGQMLTAQLDLDKLVQALTDAATELTGAEFGAFFYNLENDEREANTLITVSGVRRELFEGFPMPRVALLFSPAFRSEAIVRIDDMSKYPGYGDTAPYYGFPEGHLKVTSYLAVPVVSRTGAVLGGLFFGHSEPGKFSLRAEEIASGIAAQAAVAMDNAHLFQLATRERAHAETREQRYLLLTQAMPQIVWTTRANGEVEFYNQRWYEYTGLGLEESMGFGALEVLHPDDRSIVLKTWTQCVELGESYEVEYRIRRASDGSYRWHLARGLPVKDDQGMVVQWFGTCTDIDDQKRREEAQRFLIEAGRVLASSLDYETTLRELSRLAVPQVADWCVVDIVAAPGKLRRLVVHHGDPEKTRMARTITETYPPNPEADSSISSVLRTRKPTLIQDVTETVLRDAAHNEQHFALLSAMNFRSAIMVPMVARDQVLGSITFATAESGRRYDEQDLSMVEELANRASLAVDNANLYKLAQEGVDREQEHARRLRKLADAALIIHSAPALQETLDAITEQARAIIGTHQAFASFNAGDRPVTAVSSSETDTDDPPGGQLAMPLVDQDGEEMGVIQLSGKYEGDFSEEDQAILTQLAHLASAALENVRLFQAAQEELTERRRAEAELARSNRDLEQFAYAASHDLQEPLRSVNGYVKLLARRYESRLDDDAGELVRGAVDAVDRMQQLIQDLLAYSRVDRQGRSFRPTNLNLVMQRVLANLATAIEESGAAITSDPLPTVTADSAQMVQLFQNLVGNAIKFRDQAPIRIHVGVAEVENDWRFAVSDNGIGIEPEHSTRIFQLFQRLHSRREYPGTGMGLAICKKIVERHRGEIGVDSDRGKGSIFYFTLPNIENSDAK